MKVPKHASKRIKERMGLPKRSHLRLYNIAGKVITHARKTILKVNAQFLGILQKIRQKAYEI